MRLRPGTMQTQEPNLTPLLDMVLQLIMFFMICVSFVGRESDFQLRLPVMQHACPPETSSDRLVLNLDHSGVLYVSNHAPLKGDADILSFLKKGDGHVSSAPLVVIRADRETDYQTVHHLMALCKKVGLTRFQLRTAAVS